MRIALKAVIALAACATLAAAADKPNFSGEWSLDLDKSNFGPMPPPSALSRKIQHNDPEMTMEQTTTGGPQGDQTVKFKYSTDGKETSNEIMGNPAKTTAAWDGNALVISMSLDAGGNEIKITDRVTLSDDGKVMTDAQHLVLPQGELDLTYVLNKK
jgi:hypothetical protein